MLESSKRFLEGLSLFLERYPFEVSKTWKLTIRGGKRSDQPKSRDAENMNDFSDQFKNSVLVGHTEATVEEEKRGYGGGPL